METQKFEFFFQKSKKLTYDLGRNNLNFVNISPTLVIDTSIISVLHQEGLHEFSIMRSQKFDFIKKKRLTECFCCHVL